MFKTAQLQNLYFLVNINFKLQRKRILAQRCTAQLI